MKTQIYRSCLAVLSALLVCFAGAASTVQNGYSEKIVDRSNEQNSVRIRCFFGDKLFKLSVASVLDSRLSHRESDRMDIALTTGHGLVDDNGKIIEDCFVYAPNGRKMEIKSIVLAPGYEEASTTDWAVIVFDKIKSRKLIRYNVDPTLSLSVFEGLANDQTPVKFAKARGILENKQSCKLYPRRNASLTGTAFDGILPHSCKAIGGQSGSPVSIAGVSNDIVIGIHLGKSFTLPIKDISEQASWFGFMRIIDDAFLTELETIVSALERSY